MHGNMPVDALMKSLTLHTPHQQIPALLNFTFTFISHFLIFFHYIVNMTLLLPVLKLYKYG